MSNPSSALPGPAPREPQAVIAELLHALKTLSAWKYKAPKKLDEALAWRQNDEMVEAIVNKAIESGDSALQQAQATITHLRAEVERLDANGRTFHHLWGEAEARHRAGLLERDRQRAEAQATIQRLAQERDEWVDAYRSQADALTDARAPILPLQALVAQEFTAMGKCGPLQVLANDIQREIEALVDEQPYADIGSTAVERVIFRGVQKFLAALLPHRAEEEKP